MDAPATPLPQRFAPGEQANGHSYADAGFGPEPPPPTPKGPPLAREATGIPGLHVAQYASIDVIELDVGGHVVMRRVKDGSINATQLLKLAGLDRSRRQKVLDREIGGKFEKVQGGTGKYQGTWVPLKAAMDLSLQYGVHEMLEPLLRYDLGAPVPLVRTPTQSEINEQRRLLAQERNSGSGDVGHLYKADNGPISNIRPPLPSRPSLQTLQPALVPGLGVGLMKAAQNGMPNGMANGMANGQQPNPHDPFGPHPGKRHSGLAEAATINESMDTSFLDSGRGGSGVKDSRGGPTATAVAAAAAAAAAVTSPGAHDDSYDHAASMMSEEDLVTVAPLEPSESDTRIDQSREVVTELFLTADSSETRSLTDILASHGDPEIEPDVPIDDAGHTALHWAAALGRVPLVTDLLKHGANARRGNRKGESALVRAVLVTNSSDNHTFGELLNLLYPCLHLGDMYGRTVLHHIALTAGIPGRSDASRYYLDALLEWAVRWRGSSGVKWLVDELADAQDANGDTALNIAARLGSKRIAEQLVEVGASTKIPNRAGLAPADFGMDFGAKGGSAAGRGSHFDGLALGHGGAMGHTLGGPFGSLSSAFDGGHTLSFGVPSMSPPPQKHANFGHSRAGSRALVDGVDRRQDLTGKCSTALDELDRRMKQSMETKNALLQSEHAHLKEETERLNRLTERKQIILARKQQYDAAVQRLAALDAAIQHEVAEFAEHSGEETARPDPSMSFNADEPFMIGAADDLQSIPPAILEARLRAYRDNDEKLLHLRNQLKLSSLDGEAKFRKVVAQCTSNDEGKIDELLEDLLAAVSKSG